LWYFYLGRADCRGSRELGAQLLSLAQRIRDPILLLLAHRMLGQIVYFQGEFATARTHLEQGIALYDPDQHGMLAYEYAQDPAVACRSWLALVLWGLGYPNQALQQSEKALALAHTLKHPYSLAYALNWSAWLHHVWGDQPTVDERARAAMLLSTEQGFALWLASTAMLRGLALVQQGQGEAGIAEIRQGIAAWRATGAEIWRPYWLALLAEAYGKVGRAADGLSVLSEARATVQSTGEHCWEAELLRIQGELLLKQMFTDEQEAESCLHQAIDVARRQQAKALELRAAISLARLWQQQGKCTEAHALLAPIYGWFTEGFDTADLQEAKALLDALA
jgi:predicted ATPase